MYIDPVINHCQILELSCIFSSTGCTSGSTRIDQGGNSYTEKSKKTNARVRLDADQKVFYVYKGVKCFDFSKDKNIIVTGGMDRIVRLWNPYVSE